MEDNLMTALDGLKSRDLIIIDDPKAVEPQTEALERVIESIATSDNERETEAGAVKQCYIFATCQLGKEVH